MVSHKYATPSGEMEPTDVRARAVGNAVYLEHIGGCGDIFAWGARDKDAAEAIAGELNAVLNGLRAALADSAKKAGEYAHAARGWIDAAKREAEEYRDRLADMTAERDCFARESDRLRAGIMRPAPDPFTA